MNLIVCHKSIRILNKKELLNFLLDEKNGFYKPYVAEFDGGFSTYQNHGQLHLQLPKKIINNLVKKIYSLVDKHYSITDMWSNLHPNNSFTARHHHSTPQYPNLISGVYYLKKPKDSGNLVFDDYGVVKVKENDIILFNQSENLGWHWTERNLSKQQRVIISFNLAKTK